MTRIGKLAVVIFLLSPMAANADPIVIDFEDSEFGAQLPTVTSNGFTFTGSGNAPGVSLLYVVNSPNDTSGAPDNGTKYLLHNDFGSAGSFPIMTLTEDNGSLFDLLGFDVSERQIPLLSAEILFLTGIKGDGSTVAAVFQLDGLIDGFGGIDDFQSVLLSDAFTGLSAVQFLGFNNSSGDTQGYALDNIIVTQVPEPTTIALLGIGLFGMGLSRRKKV